MSLAASLLLLLTAPAEVVDTLYATGFEQGLGGWSAYDNWGKPTLETVTEGPLGQAARLSFDDHSTLAHFDKGLVLRLPAPLPWPNVDRISARYLIDRPVANVRIFCHCDRGGWWDYTDARPTVGQPATVSARRADFRLAWTDQPGQPAPERTGNILAVYFSVHNAGAVNRGERFALQLDDVSIVTSLLPLPEPLRGDDPPLGCWPLAEATADGWQTAVALRVGDRTLQWRRAGERIELTADAACDAVVAGRALRLPGELPLAALAPDGALRVEVGEAAWAGRHRSVGTLTPREALGLSLRTGAATWRAEAPGLEATLVARLPAPWSSGLTALLGTQDLAGKPEGDAWRFAGAAEPGIHRATLRWTGRGSSLEVVTTATVLELDRAALAAAAGGAGHAAEALAARARSQRGEAWWTAVPLRAEPLVKDRQRVDPERWSLVADPVTWHDLGGDFQGGAQCGIDERSVRTFFDHYDFGRVIKPHLGPFLSDGCLPDLRRIAERELVVGSVWGYVPDAPWNGGFGEASLPLARHEQIREILGRRFLGYEMGEQDGRYMGSYAPRYQPADRAAARALCEQWHQAILDKFHHCMVGLGSLNLAHQDARLGHRMIGIEAAQGLPSDTMEWAHLRGASKQFGLLPWNCISIYNRWGYKSYASTGKDHGPDQGTSLALLKRLWYATWLYGSAVNMFEGAYFTADKDAEGFAKLSPVGQAHVDAVAFARAHQDRGVLYTPVALMLSPDAGWLPPRHLYTGRRHLVWGNLPYGRGDHATDAFFRWIWPKYEDCSYYPDERGFLTATPFGDQFDVIQADAGQECLARYQTVVLLGDLAADAALAERLATFVRDGGELVAHAGCPLPESLLGLRPGEVRRAAQRAVVLPAGEVLAEEPYSYRPAVSTGARALVLSEHGDGILWERPLGRGRVVWSAVANYVGAETEDPQPGVDVPLQHRLLRSFQAVVGRYLTDLRLVTVDGPPVQVTCNVGANPKRLVIGLFNHETAPASVRVAARRGAFTAASPWIGQAVLRDGAIAASVPAGELVIVEAEIR